MINLDVIFRINLKISLLICFYQIYHYTYTVISRDTEIYIIQVEIRKSSSLCLL